MTTTDTIPDLWPTAALKIDVRTPVAILRAQATNLGQKTRGVLISDVTITKGEDNQVVLGLEVIVPALNNYRYRLLSVQHAQGATYPAKVFANGFTTTQSVPSNIFTFTGPTTTTIKVGTKTAYSDEDFLRIVYEALQAPETIAFMQSLIVRSNEETSASSPNDEKEEEEEEVEAQKK